MNDETPWRTPETIRRCERLIRKFDAVEFSELVSSVLIAGYPDAAELTRLSCDLDCDEEDAKWAVMVIAYGEKEAAKTWLEHFAGMIQQDYEELLAVCKRYAENDEEYTYDNSENYKDVDWKLWPRVWKCYGVLTGDHITRDNEEYIQDCPFTCSC